MNIIRILSIPFNCLLAVGCAYLSLLSFAATLIAIFTFPVLILLLAPIAWVLGATARDLFVDVQKTLRTELPILAKKFDSVKFRQLLSTRHLGVFSILACFGLGILWQFLK
jgi:hypothetical protein